MQISRSPSRFALAAMLALAGIALSAGPPAHAAIGEWAYGAKARVRLVADRSAADGTLSAAIEVDLPRGWKTYWRNPGDAGIPPTTDFSASRNLGPVTVAFPVPERFDDGYAVTNVYHNSVVLPVSASIPDASSDVVLKLSMDLGVCEEVCVPDHVDVTLDVPPAADPRAAEIIATARKQVPGSPEPGVLDVDTVSRQGGTDKRPVFDITTTVPDPSDATVFVEGPSDWYGDPPKKVSSDGNRIVYRVKFDRLTAKTPIPGSHLTVTIVSGGRAAEQSVGLD